MRIDRLNLAPEHSHSILACPIIHHQAKSGEPSKPNETFNAPSRPLCAPVGRFVFGVLGLWLLSFCIPALSISQTEVSGEVSGNWEVEGSPYILTDTTIVPAGESLVITAGVDVIIRQGSLLMINGGLTIEGTADDSVHITVTQNDVIFPAIHAVIIDLENARDVVNISYLSVTDSPNYFMNLLRGGLNISHSLFTTNEEYVECPWFERRGADTYSNVTINDSEFQVSPIFMGDFWVIMEMNRVRITNEDAIAMIFESSLTIDSCTALSAGVIASGRLIVRHSEIGPLDFAGGEFIVENNYIADIPRLEGGGVAIRLSWECRDYLIRNNVIEGSINVRDWSNGLIEGNSCDGVVLFGLRPGYATIIDNNVIRGRLYSPSDGEALLTFVNNSVYDIFIDNDNASDVLIEGNRIENGINRAYSYCNISTDNLTFRNNLVVGSRFSIFAGVNNILVNNTFDLTDWPISFHLSNPITLCNNLFYNNSTIGNRSYIQYNRNTEYEATNNCFYQTNPPEFADESNIYIDPGIRMGTPINYELRPGSVCIDAGSPDSPADTDGSRADIGAFWFDHREDHMPCIYSDEHDFASLDSDYRYEIKVCDDGDNLAINILEQPEWFDALERDFVEETLTISGHVPEEQRDFEFVIEAVDDAGQIDSQRVRVQVNPFHLLRGEVIGELSPRDEPYLIVEPVVVPRGEELRILPGTVILVRQGPFWRMSGLRTYNDINIFGKLSMIGTEEDSITITSEMAWLHPDSLIAGDDWFYGGLFIQPGADTCSIAYSKILYSYRSGITVDSAALTVDHCYFSGNVSSHIDVRENASLICRHTYFDHTWEAATPDNNHQTYEAISYSASNICVDSSIFAGPGGFTYQREGIPTSGFSQGWPSGPAILSVTNCLFDRMGMGLEGDDGSAYRVEHCIFKDNQTAIRLLYSPSATVLNNTFIGNYTHLELTAYGNENQGNGSIDIRNNIFYGRRGAPAVRMKGPYPTYSFEYNNYQDSTIWHSVDGSLVLDETCIRADPLILDIANHDFRLHQDSPCIDSGDPEAALDPDGSRSDMGAIPFDHRLTAVREPNSLPREYRLYEPFPNPFNSAFELKFDLPSPVTATIDIYDANGRRVQQLTSDHSLVGSCTTSIDGSSWTTGHYFIVLKAGGYSNSARVVLIK